jgi:hypothetical protein
MFAGNFTLHVNVFSGGLFLKGDEVSPTATSINESVKESIKVTSLNESLLDMSR